MVGRNIIRLKRSDMKDITDKLTKDLFIGTCPKCLSTLLKEDEQCVLEGCPFTAVKDKPPFDAATATGMYDHDY